LPGFGTFAQVSIIRICYADRGHPGVYRTDDIEARLRAMLSKLQDLLETAASNPFGVDWTY
jgi:hypothetical protein